MNSAKKLQVMKLVWGEPLLQQPLVQVLVPQLLAVWLWQVWQPQPQLLCHWRWLLELCHL